MSIRTVDQIQADLFAGHDRIQAIVEVAQDEGRDLDANEQNEFDAWHGKGEETGQFGKLEAELERAKKIEARTAKIVAERAAPKLQAHMASSVIVKDDGFVVPQAARRYGHLKAFKDEKEAYTAGQFLMATIGHDVEAQQWCRDNGVAIQAAMSTTDNTKGGFLVPESMEAAIIRLVEERGVFRRFARPWPMTTPVDHHPRRESGVTVYMVGENQEVTASDPDLGDVELVAKTMAALIKISRRFNATSIISIADWLTTEIAYGFADKEDENGFNGDGTSTYGGVTGLKNALEAGSIADGASGSVSFETLTLADFRSAISKLKHVTGIMPAWFINKTGYELSMQRLKDAGGGNNNTDLAQGSDQMFLGYPVHYTQVLPSTSTVSTVQAYFGDLRMTSTLGTLQGVSIESNGGGEYFKKLQIAIMGYQDVAINNHERGTATEGGTMIGVKTAAS